MRVTVIFIDTESGREYNLTFKEEVARLRADLDAKGFFGVGQNKKYWDWFDRIITQEEFKDFLGAVQLYNAILKSKKGLPIGGNLPN